MQLTIEGRSLIAKAEPLLQQWEEMVVSLDNPARPSLVAGGIACPWFYLAQFHVVQTRRLLPPCHLVGRSNAKPENQTVRGPRRVDRLGSHRRQAGRLNR